MKSSPIAMLISAVAALSACGEGRSEGGALTRPYSPHPSCNAIIQACHPVDVGLGPVNDCHGLGHDGKSEAECAGRKDECVALCNDAAEDAGSIDPDDASADAGGD
jgi:hypothetical protein